MCSCGRDAPARTCSNSASTATTTGPLPTWSWIPSKYYVTPTEDNLYQTEKMKSHGIFSEVNQDVGEIIVAEVNRPRIAELLKPDRVELRKLITKEG